MTAGLIYGVVLTFGVEATVRDRPGGPRYREVVPNSAAVRGLDPGRVTLYFDDGARLRLIGRGITADVSPSELAMGFRVASAAGTEALELARAGVIADFGVAFRPIRDRQRADGVVERLEIDIDRVALLERGAYAGTGVREARAATAAEVERLERAFAAELGHASADAEEFRRRVRSFVNARP